MPRNLFTKRLIYYRKSFFLSLINLSNLASRLCDFESNNNSQIIKISKQRVSINYSNTLTTPLLCNLFHPRHTPTKNKNNIGVHINKLYLFTIFFYLLL